LYRTGNAVSDCFDECLSRLRDFAAETNRPSKSLHRSEKGNPSMDNLAAIFGTVRKRLGVAIEARAI